MASSSLATPSLAFAVPRVRTTTRIQRPPKASPSRHVRSFNSTRPAPALHGTSQMPKNMMSKLPPQQAMNTKMKNLSPEEIPDDLGLMPQTLIRPLRSELPRFFSAGWKERVKFEWLWTRTRFQNFFTLFYFLRWSVPKATDSKKKRKLPYHILERTEVARMLHEKYYRALASGDMIAIKKIACRGLLLSSGRRIGQRGPGEKSSFAITGYPGIKYPQFLRWPLLSMLPFSATKVVSDKVVPLPFGQNNLLRQCVVRIRTRQKLDKLDGKGPKEAELTEYVVIQRRSIDGVDDGWKIWGTVKPSTRQEIEKLLGGESTVPKLTDRLQSQVARLTGM